MAEARLFQFAGEAEPQTRTLDERLFGASVNADLLYRAVRMQRGNRRQGTHSTKTRGEVSGGGRKPWRQKGTGRARAGSRRSKKMKQGALFSALSDRAREERLTLIDRIGFEQPKTKAAVALLDRLGLSESTLVVVGSAEYGRPVKKSFTNLPGVKCIACGGVNVYDVLRHDHLLMTVGAVEELEERFRT
jgi:large subunit ribosomal protein L4